MDKVEATGGGDEAEDVAGALLKAHEMTQKNAAGMTLVFLISQSPTHGKQYHNIGQHVGDDLKNSVSEGHLENIVKKFSKIPNLWFFMIQFDESTRTMYKIIKENLQRNTTEILKDLTPQLFTGTVLEKIKDSYT